MAAEQPWPQSNWLHNLGHSSATSPEYKVQDVKVSETLWVVAGRHYVDTTPTALRSHASVGVVIPRCIRRFLFLPTVPLWTYDTTNLEQLSKWVTDSWDGIEHESECWFIILHCYRCLDDRKIDNPPSGGPKLTRVPTPPGKSWIFCYWTFQDLESPGKSLLSWKVLEKYPWKSCIFLVVQMENKHQ